MGCRTFDALIVLVMGLLGVPLFRRPVRWQLALLLLTAAALLLVGVFLPELLRSIFASIFLPVRPSCC